jgi:hypothetical protein
MSNKVVRVGVLNNFNCTDKEYSQLQRFDKEHPDCYFFVNSNINTPNLRNINNYHYKAVITANPNITDYSFFKLGQVNKSKLAFVRVKYVPNNPYIVNLIKLIASCDIPVVVTLQRFNSKRTVLSYGINNYIFDRSRYRLNEKARKPIERIADNTKNVYICDRSGNGCTKCNLCATLTLGEVKPIYSLNMSSSGICKFNCIDCFAKTMQRFVVKCGHNPIEYDVIKKNHKQREKKS